MYAVVDGGVVPSGNVRVSGAKNSATRLLAAALLADEAVELQNFPTKLVDVGHKVEFCRAIGAEISVEHGNESVIVTARELGSRLLSPEQYEVPIRTTYLLAAAQLLRTGIARIPYPAGCRIGPGSSGGRGYDLHVMVWEKFGASVVEREDHIEISAPSGLRGSEIAFPISTVGGTENALMCASVATGTTQIRNAYITPEVRDLIELLRGMGADISIFGTSHIVVQGAGATLSGAHARVMSDRIEALTWIVFAILTRGNLTIEGVPFSSMGAPLLHLEHAGIDLFRNSTAVHVTPECLIAGQVQPFEVACGAYPGVISDMQAFFVLLGLAGAGTSRIYDYRYPDRIAFVFELANLVGGDHLLAKRGEITVHGPGEFRAGVARSTDLRGSMAAVLAALIADGRSVVQEVQMALRGYNDLIGKLESIGSRIELFDEMDLPTDARDMLSDDAAGA